MMAQTTAKNASVQPAGKKVYQAYCENCHSTGKDKQLGPGMYHINVRVDGGPWMAPPGIPTMHDGFSGDVGLIVVPR